MCGIVGIVSLRDSPPRVADVRSMAGTLVHRGPDADGFFHDERAALGFRRLSIIDLEHGNQPMFNEDESVAAFQNGEIYNYVELRRGLEARGHRFTTTADTEVIPHLYEQEGDRFVEHLRGMFAVAVYDRRRRRLVLARDRLGKKPLYYAELPGALAYASEMKALLTLPDVARDLDETALLDFFSYRGVPAPRTILRSVRKLEPGHLLVVDEDGVRAPRPYWRLSFAAQETAPPEQLTEQLAALLDESVRLRMVADVPVGALLSGGIDSAAVVSAMVAARPEEVRTFSVGFGDPRHDERAEARATAVALGTVHTDSHVSLDVEEALDMLAWHFDEPFSDASAVPTYAVSKLARQHVTVVLSGDGGDEGFAGYSHHHVTLLTDRLRAVAPPGMRSLARLAASAYPTRGLLARRLRGRTLLTNVADDAPSAYARAVSATSPSVTRRILSGDVRARLRGYDPADVIRDAFARSDAPDPLGRLLQTDFQTYLVTDILTKVDRASMAASLEVRCPLLDHHLVEFAARIPSALKLQRGASKWILRRAVAGRVPPEVLRRPKHGFDTPLRVWTLGQLRPAITAAIADAPMTVFDRAGLAAAWNDHLAGFADHSELFWAFILFDRWRRRHGIPLT